MCIRVCSALASTAANVALDAKTRAIANVLGVSRETVRKEVATSPDNNLSGDAKPPNHLLKDFVH